MSQSVNFAQDSAECEKDIGKSPPVPPVTENVIIISDGVARRIQSGGLIDDERVTNYENYWMNRLACIDRGHTKRNNLNLDEAERILKLLTSYLVMQGREKICSSVQRRVSDCYRRNKGQALKCNGIIEQFLQCVNQTFYNTTCANLKTYAATEEAAAELERKRVKK